ncbi:MAG: hypothetical protein U0271_01605 [Polyangiaceae bacterium]
MRVLLHMCLASLALGAAACGDSGVSPPPGQGGGGAGGGLTFEEHPRIPISSSTPKRTVEQRNPFGNVAATENLLWDGDFEWWSPFSDEYGWFDPPLNPTLDDVPIGSVCKSGVQCARLKKKNNIVGIAVGSSDKPLSASIYARFEVAAGVTPPGCSSASVSVFDAGQLSPADPDVELVPESETPGEDGWCKLSALVPVRAHKPYILVTNKSAELSMIIDDAVLIVAPEGQASGGASPLPTHTARLVDDPEIKAALDQARAAVRALGAPQDGAPNPAREALARWRSSR